jgi:hypothetical protein
MRTTRIISIPLAVLLTTAAGAGPAAAVPADVGRTPPTPQHIVQPAPPVDARSSSFDWGSAGIGAAGGVGALAIALAGATGMRRRRLERLRTIPTRWS